VTGIIVILLIAGAIGYVYYDGQQTQLRLVETAKEQVEVLSKEFSQGESIKFFTPPAFTDDEVSQMNAERAFNDFFQEASIDDVIDLLIADRNELHGEIVTFLITNGLDSDFTITFIDKLEKNELTEYDILKAKENLTAEEKNELQVLLNKDNSQKEELENVMTNGISGANVTSVHYEGLRQVAKTEIKDGVHVVYQGDLAKIVGKIVKPIDAPYFYNIDISCCDQKEVLQKTHIGTDGDGNFLYEFPTNDNTPLGHYRVSIITTSNDGSSLIEYFYEFQVIN
jgi:hypothetical protein